MQELHSDEDDPEFMFQDYECLILEKLGLLSECHISKDIYDVLKQINDSGHDIAVYEACLDKMDFQSLYVNNFTTANMTAMKILYNTCTKMIHLIFLIGL